jgi:Cu+-exporting ATPase
MSIMVGTGRGASLGVLVRRADALEIFSRADTLLIDKTGTLTEGKPRLAAVLAVPGFEPDRVLALAASLEVASEHPLAAAIVEGAAKRGLALQPVLEFNSIVGQGVFARIGGAAIGLGSSGLLESLGMDASVLSEDVDRHRRSGATVVFLLNGDALAGALVVEDPIRASAGQAIRELRASGMHVVMVTGDHEITARSVAKKLGIDDVRAGVLPTGKALILNEFALRGHIVAMAGDGTNDAPALAAAHVGIAMGTGTDVANETAGITLVGGDLLGLVRARSLSAKVMRNIRQNLFFAFAYNAIGIPVAAGIAMPLFNFSFGPMFAAAAMTFSSVSVIANALRLRTMPV